MASPPDTLRVRTTRPPWPARTVRVWASRSTVETWARPTVNRTSLFWVPNSPGAPWTSFSRSATATLVPGAQYARGRKSSRWPPNQCAATSTGGSAVTAIARSTAARSVTGRLNRSETGIPTPTVEPSSGVKKATKVCARAMVEKSACWTARCPWSSSATASRVNFVPSGSGPPLLSASRTDTSRPWATLTRTGPSGGRFWVSSAGSAVIDAREAGGGPDGSARTASALVLPGPPPPPEHPASTTRQQPTAASRRAHIRPRGRIPGPPAVAVRYPAQRGRPPQDTPTRRKRPLRRRSNAAVPGRHLPVTRC